MAVGLLCGIFGHDKHAEPTERGAISNMGGNCLMAAVGFMFIFVFFLMIFAAICFFLGAHLEKGCYSVREETIYDDVCSFTLFVYHLLVLEFSNIFTRKRQASFIFLQAYFPPPSPTLLLLVFFSSVFSHLLL